MVWTKGISKGYRKSWISDLINKPIPRTRLVTKIKINKTTALIWIRVAKGNPTGCPSTDGIKLKTFDTEVGILPRAHNVSIIAQKKVVETLKCYIPFCNILNETLWNLTSARSGVQLAFNDYKFSYLRLQTLACVSSQSIVLSECCKDYKVFFLPRVIFVCMFRSKRYTVGDCFIVYNRKWRRRTSGRAAIIRMKNWVNQLYCCYDVAYYTSIIIYLTLAMSFWAIERYKLSTNHESVKPILFNQLCTWATKHSSINQPNFQTGRQNLV